MNFQEQLNMYMEKLHCTGRELASESGVSETIISRYRKGDRIPAADSAYLQRLVEGIAQLAEKRGEPDMEETHIWNSLRESLQLKDLPAFPYEKLDLLLRDVEVNLSALAAFLHYDASYLSKIRMGKRKPAREKEFIENVCIYIVKNSPGMGELERLAALIGCEAEALQETEAAVQLLKQWM